jgi:threonine dehydratase
LRCDWRLFRFRATISDRPGGLEKLTHILADVGASVKQISHERTFGPPHFSSVDVVCVVETRDKSHADELVLALGESGIKTVAF